MHPGNELPIFVGVHGRVTQVRGVVCYRMQCLVREPMHDEDGWTLEFLSHCRVLDDAAVALP